MFESGIEVLDAIANNPMQSLALFAGAYVVYRCRSARERRFFNHSINEFIDLWSFQLFPMREEYEDWNLEFYRKNGIHYKDRFTMELTN